MPTMTGKAQANERILADLSRVHPVEAVSPAPAPDKWLVLPYEADGITGKMLYRPMLSTPPDVSVRLPDLGLCRVYVGIYGCGEASIWKHVFYGRQLGARPWRRLHLRFSDEDYYDQITPDDFPEAPLYRFISESRWRTADVTGRSLVFSAPWQEAFRETDVGVAYVRLVPVNEKPAWPAETKRLVNYFDGNFMGHFVRNVADVKTHISPLAETDAKMVFWNTCREDTCYYPTKVGNPLPWHGTPGLYPHWTGRDFQAMLAAGLDPLKVACDVAHETGLEFYSSYRRLTRRVAPHTPPVSPNALLVTHPELRCMDRDGRPLPHLSLTHARVRQRMIDLLSEQARNYDIDGVHLFFCRGVPFVFFEPPFLERFRERHGLDARALPVDDRRVWEVRAEFVIQLFRELRAAMEAIGKERGREVKMAVTVMNKPDACAYFGLDVATLCREKLVDLLVPFPCHYLPEELGEWNVTPDYVAQFVALAKPNGIGVYPDCGDVDGYDYSNGKLKTEQRAAEFYRAGADGLQLHQTGLRGDGRKREDAAQQRLGHIDELDQAERRRAEAARWIELYTVSGVVLDHQRGGVGTCG